jgi:hypothetical protein
MTKHERYHEEDAWIPEKQSAVPDGELMHTASAQQIVSALGAAKAKILVRRAGDPARLREAFVCASARAGNGTRLLAFRRSAFIVSMASPRRLYPIRWMLWYSSAAGASRCCWGRGPSTRHRRRNREFRNESFRMSSCSLQTYRGNCNAWREKGMLGS